MTRLLRQAPSLNDSKKQLKLVLLNFEMLVPSYKEVRPKTPQEQDHTMTLT